MLLNQILYLITLTHYVLLQGADEGEQEHFKPLCPITVSTINS